MTNLMLQLLELTVSMSVLITFILLFFKLFGKKFTSKCKYIVWTIVILRLCLPVGIFSAAPLFEIKVPNIRNTSVNTADTVGDSEISIPNTTSEKLPSNNISGTISPDNNMQTPTVNPDVIPDITPKTTPSEPDTPVLPNNKADNSTTTENIHTEFMPSENETEKKITHIPSIDIIPALLCFVWAAGAVLFIGARLIPYAVYVRRMKKVGLLNAPSEEANAVYDALCRKIGVKRPPKLLVSRVPVSPHLCGFIRRKIIIPDMTYAMNDIESILSHELTHFKRGDLYVKLACTAAQAVSWFNPLVHLASGKCISEMELSCDESVLKNSNEEERILYGNAMLDIVRRCGHVKGAYLTSDFRPKHGAVKERIMNIINSEKKKKGIGIIAIALALCITAGTVIGCTVSAKESAKKSAETPITETDAPETDVSETDIPTWKQESLERRQEMHDFAEAFVKRDISKCAEIHRKYYYHSEDQSAAEERFAPLATLEFSKYDIEDVNGDSEYNDSIKMTFTISSSGYDAFPVGDYEGSLSIGPEGIYWKLKKPDDIAPTEEEQAAVDFITPLYPYMDKEDPEAARKGMTFGIFRALNKISDDPTKEVRATLEEIKEAAVELYGAHDFIPDEHETKLWENGYYTILGRCGDLSFQRIKKIEKVDNLYLIDVQYFNEPIYFTPTNTVRYTVAETDSRFGYRLEGSEIIKGNYNNTPNIQIPLQGEPTIKATPEQLAYLGIWYNDDSRTDSINIKEITEDTVKFESGFYRVSSFTATAVKSGDEYIFGNGISEFNYSVDMIEVLQGRLRFDEDGITVIYDRFGENAASHLKDGDVYNFTLRSNDDIDRMRDFADAIRSQTISTCALVYMQFNPYSYPRNDDEAIALFESVSTLKFSEFCIYEDVNEYNDRYVCANFTVAESDSAAFPVGNYQSYFSIGPAGLYWHLKKPNEITLDEEQTEAYNFISNLLPCMGKQAYDPNAYDEIYKNDPNMGFVIPEEVFDIACRMKGVDAVSENTSVTLAELQTAAEEGLGIKDFYPGEYSTSIMEENGEYYRLGHCGLHDFTRIRNVFQIGDIYYIDIEYYNDSTFCSLGNVVRFSIRKTDSAIGYRLEKTEIIEENYTPSTTDS